MMLENIDTSKIPIGVVGLGLMGTSIATTFILAGHPVVALAPIPEDMNHATTHIRKQLEHCQSTGLLSKPIDAYLAKLSITEDYQQLKDCQMVLECVIEILEIKTEVYHKIAEAIEDDAIVASNTSAIPISVLQKNIPNPKRFLGIHWGEPAYLSRFLEIVCGEQTDINKAKWAKTLAPYWSKEPTLLRKDIRGFVTNRLMYSIYREALTLVEEGETTLEDTDKVFRYDAGSWITLMGLFRRMDFNGLKDYTTILNNLFPGLSNREDVPLLMQKLIEEKSRGVQNTKGLYQYSKEEAKRWEEAFSLFNGDIYHLAKKYPVNLAKNINAKD
ncbi:3-hydroxybutyryl-CoA dehydrogenase [Catalinimonas alkaloidigena]|uniref:3-hydroxyacyl-CoA dehydrogenase family protein n=1 Tax=Catalinimonas alkaloidigena TaxID=1075417 RepID=UPI002405D6AA|nr:3-hydroxyacyl-CoA dehydrogenase family protein [Catalinimonas alkaloidigena]MDF9798943.1 3-hydroxybutyryl-CoA dehydrogenase [Catalinimonas alkaloidigena]